MFMDLRENVDIIRKGIEAIRKNQMKVLELKKYNISNGNYTGWY